MKTKTSENETREVLLPPLALSACPLPGLSLTQESSRRQPLGIWAPSVNVQAGLRALTWPCTSCCSHLGERTSGWKFLSNNEVFKKVKQHNTNIKVEFSVKNFFRGMSS